ncbi:hypothetical protein FACS1894180_9440 [Bacteroidia bacterium]|nr:hypothetical protein FACS1894180_9440 [Bacteroidia bacterium]
MENQKTTATTTEVAKKEITARVLAKVETFRATGELRVPKDYSPENALKAAYFTLLEVKDKNGRLAMEACSKESVANSLLKMVVWGLSPLKKQCDFIVYGNQLQCQIEYTGNIALAKRYGGLKDIKAHAIFEGDKFGYEIDITTGRTRLLEHVPTLESIGTKKLRGAYAVLIFNDGTTDVEVMNIAQIEQINFDGFHRFAANAGR